MHTTVFVRTLSTEERAVLERLLGRSPSARVWRRAQAISLSAEGVTVPQIARFLRMSSRTVRDLIREYSQKGIPALYDGERSGRKKNFPQPRWAT
jgi:transposase